MTLTTPYSATFIVGDGETKTFSYLFEEVSSNFISVMVYNSVTGLISTPTYIIDTDQKQVIFGEDTPAPTADETVCIYRNTPNVQDVAFRTLHGYDAQTLENILSKIVAMIQEIKSNYFSTQVLQGDPWQLDLLSSEDDGATVNIDYTAKKLVKGLYFKITSGNLQVSADGTNYITMPKSADVVEFRQHETVKEDLTVEYRLQYRVGNTWYNAESNAESTANEALQVAEEARDIANDAKDIAQDASDKVDGFDDRLTQAEQNASDAKDIAQDASDAVSAHITDTNNPHNVTAAQIGALPDTTKYGATLSLTIDSTTYIVTAQLKDQDGNNLGTAQTIDLPLESVVVSGAYDSVTKEVVLTLQGGSTIRFSVADLVSGLQTEITALNMLSADLVDDTNTTHKFVTTTEKSTWNGKQDAISDLATIRSGATAGATAVQPGDLATVATSGLYNDLTDKPTIPTVGNGTITITQGGVTKGTFTTNQSGDTTIDVDAGGGSGLPDQTGQSGKFLTTDGTDASWSDKPLVNNATGTNALGVGNTGVVLGDNSTVVGTLSKSYAAGGNSVVVGYMCGGYGFYSVAIGNKADASARGAIQIGASSMGSTNSDANTMKVANANGNFEIMSADGTIPEARLADTTNAQEGDVLTLDSTGNAVWQAGSGGGVAGQSIDAEIVGTLTVADNGDVSGFSPDDYLLYPGRLDVASAGSFELFFAFTTNNNTNGIRLFYPSLSGSNIENISFYSSTDSQDVTTLNFTVYSGVNSINIQGATPILADTKYYVRVIYDGTDYSFSISTDNINWTNEGSVAATIIPKAYTRGRYIIGRSGATLIQNSGIKIMHMNECYIKEGGIITWQGLGDPGLHQRVSKAEADYVVESQFPTAANNLTWYRKYKSGWVEQGQYKRDITKNQANIVTLPVPMADTNFGGSISCSNITYGAATTLSIDSHSTTQVNLWGYTGAAASTIRVSWEVKGWAA